MVRVAGLRGMVSAGLSTPSDDGLTPAQQLVRIEATVSELIADQQNVWSNLRSELRVAGIAVLKREELTVADRGWLDAHFREQIFRCLRHWHWIRPIHSR